MSRNIGKLLMLVGPVVAGMADQIPEGTPMDDYRWVVSGCGAIIGVIGGWLGATAPSDHAELQYSRINR